MAFSLKVCAVNCEKMWPWNRAEPREERLGPARVPACWLLLLLAVCGSVASWFSTCAQEQMRAGHNPHKERQVPYDAQTGPFGVTDQLIQQQSGSSLLRWKRCLSVAAQRHLLVTLQTSTKANYFFVKVSWAAVLLVYILGDEWYTCRVFHTRSCMATCVWALWQWVLCIHCVFIIGNKLERRDSAAIIQLHHFSYTCRLLPLIISQLIKQN